MNEFDLSLKTTIDKLLFDLATLHGYGFFDLDGVYQSASKVADTAPAICWTFLSSLNSAKDPRGSLVFEAGAKTTADLSQYLSLEVASRVKDFFSENEDFEVKDYRGVDAGTEVLGRVFIKSAMLVPPVFDAASGFRMVNLEAQVLRF